MIFRGRGWKREEPTFFSPPLTLGTAAHIYIYREPDDFLRHTYPIRFLRRRDPPCLLVPVPLVFPLFPRLIVQAGHVRNPLSDQENASPPLLSLIIQLRIAFPEKEYVRKARIRNNLSLFASFSPLSSNLEQRNGNCRKGDSRFLRFFSKERGCVPFFFSRSKSRGRPTNGRDRQRGKGRDCERSTSASLNLPP